jgi:hypothetical protein
VVSLVMFLSGVTCLSLLVLHTLVQCFAATVASYLMLLLLPETEKMNCAVTTVQEAWHNPMGSHLLPHVRIGLTHTHTHDTAHDTRFLSHCAAR